MRIVVERSLFSDKSTIGQLLIDDRFFCYTLEDRDRNLEDGGEKVYGETAIPRGVYTVKITKSNRFKKDLPLLLDVPQFTGVRIHPGNTDADTDGCILVGEGYTDDFISNSRATFGRLMKRIEDAIADGECVKLEVV